MSDFRAESNYRQIFDRGEASSSDAEPALAAPQVDVEEKMQQSIDLINQLQKEAVQFLKTDEDKVQLAELVDQVILSAAVLVKIGRMEEAITKLSRVETNLTNFTQGEYDWQQSLSEVSSEQGLVDWLINPMNKLSKNGRDLDSSAMAHDVQGIFAAVQRGDQEKYQQLLAKIPSNTVRDKIKQLAPEPPSPQPTPEVQEPAPSAASVEPPAPVERDPSLAETPSTPPEEPDQPKKEPDTLDKVKAATSYDELVFIFSDHHGNLSRQGKILLANDIQNTLVSARAILERTHSLPDAQNELQKLESRTVREQASALLAEVAATLPPKKKGLLSGLKEFFTGTKPENAQLISDILAVEKVSDLINLLSQHTSLKGVPEILARVNEANAQLQKNQTDPKPERTQAASSAIFKITNEDIREKVKTLLLQEFNLSQS